MMRMLKLYAVSVLCSSVVFVASGLAQTETSQNRSVAPATRVYIGPDGHPHLPLTPDGDIQTDPNVQPQPARAPLGTLGIRATPNFPPCPPNDEAVRQARENVADKEWPHRMAYVLFFNNMEAVDRAVAEYNDKQEGHKKESNKIDDNQQADNGGQGITLRHDTQLSGLLSDTEEQIVKEIEVDFTRAMKVYHQKQFQAIRRFRLATNGDMCAPPPQEFADLNREQWAIAEEHITQLRVALGAASFQKLDKFVRDTWQPRKQQNPGPPSAKK
jgi:hypothetical protein